MRTNAITKLTTKTNCVDTGEFYAARDQRTSVTTTRGECNRQRCEERRKPHPCDTARRNGSKWRLSSWWT